MPGQFDAIVGGVVAGVAALLVGRTEKWLSLPSLTKDEAMMLETLRSMEQAWLPFDYESTLVVIDDGPDMHRIADGDRKRFVKVIKGLEEAGFLVYDKEWRRTLLNIKPTYRWSFICKILNRSRWKTWPVFRPAIQTQDACGQVFIS